jgi:hypothetical protein
LPKTRQSSEVRPSMVQPRSGSSAGEAAATPAARAIRKAATEARNWVPSMSAAALSR